MPTEPNDALKLAASFAGETFLPGGANLVRGDVVQGGLHFALGLAARAVLGVPGVMLVSANSLVKATTGQSLPAHLGLTAPKTEEAAPTAA